MIAMMDFLSLIITTIGKRRSGVGHEEWLSRHVENEMNTNVNVYVPFSGCFYPKWFPIASEYIVSMEGLSWNQTPQAILISRSIELDHKCMLLL